MTERLTNQHGDVLVFSIESLPAGLTKSKPKNGRWILAEGETTGHAHAICDLNHCDVYCGEDGTLYLSVKESVELTHEEHATQTIAPGNYRVGRVREVDPFEGEIRAVQD